MVNTVTTAGKTCYEFSQKVVRTADGTIHVIVWNSSSGWIRHYYSYDDGLNWSYQAIWTGLGTLLEAGIDMDSSDNLHAVGVDYATACKYKKGTVTKGTPWTWSWGGEKTLAGTTCLDADIIVDGNDYLHVAIGSDSTAARWTRSIDGGVNWTITTVGDYAFDWASIVVDSNNNLYVYWGKDDGLNTIRGVKITYSAGPSWGVGTTYTLSHVNAGYGTIRVLPDDKLIFAYPRNDGTRWGTDYVYFRKSTNASDLSAWSDAVGGLATGQSGMLMVYSINRLRIYYSAPVYYIESLDSGVNWSSPISVGDAYCPNVSKRMFIGTPNKLDYVWCYGGNGIVYHDYTILEQIIKGNACIVGTFTHDIIGDAIVADTQFKTIQGDAFVVERTARIIIGNANIRADLILNHVLEKEISRVKYVSRENFIKLAPNIDENIWLKKPVVLKYGCRLTELEKVDVESCFAQELYLNDGIDNYFTWFLTKRIVYKKERHSLRPWLAELEFLIIG